MVSGIRALMADLLVHVCCEVGPPWIGLVPACPMEARSDWELGTLEAILMP